MVAVDGEFNYGHLEAAACAWEAILEPATFHLHDWKKHCQTVGYGQAREDAIRVGAFIEDAYNALNGSERFVDAFDWEFIPAVMLRVQPDATYEDVLAAAEEVLKEHEESL